MKAEKLQNACSAVKFQKNMLGREGYLSTQSRSKNSKEKRKGKKETRKRVVCLALYFLTTVVRIPQQRNSI